MLLYKDQHLILKNRKKIFHLLVTTIPIIIIINSALQNTPNIDLNTIFQNKRTVLAQKQPRNLLRIVSNKNHKNHQKKIGLFKCSDSRCKICNLYIKECQSFTLSNGKEWIIKCHITCNSTNVIYFLKCTDCDTTYIGKTNNFRLRMNGHILSCRNGNSSDRFDNHVFNCLKGEEKTEPYFQIFALMTLNDVNKLITYEKYFHRQGFDTMNHR